MSTRSRQHDPRPGQAPCSRRGRRPGPSARARLRHHPRCTPTATAAGLTAEPATRARRPPPRPPTAAADPAAERAADQWALDRLFAAGVAGNRSAGRPQLPWMRPSPRRSRLLLANLRGRCGRRRPRDRITVAAPSRPRERRRPRCRARVVQALVSWAVEGCQPAGPRLRSSVWRSLPLGRDGRRRLAGTDDGTTRERPALPLWLGEPAAPGCHRGSATVLVGPGQTAARWARLAQSGSGRAPARGSRPARPGPMSAHLVVEIPGTRDRDFERVLGVAPGSYRQIAAVTWPEGTDQRRRPVRVDGQPRDRRATPPDADSRSTLTHESHPRRDRSPPRRRRSGSSRAYADYLALPRSHPENGPPNPRSLDQSGPPSPTSAARRCASPREPDLDRHVRRRPGSRFRDLGRAPLPGRSRRFYDALGRATAPLERAAGPPRRQHARSSTAGGGTPRSARAGADRAGATAKRADHDATTLVTPDDFPPGSAASSPSSPTSAGCSTPTSSS